MRQVSHNFVIVVARPASAPTGPSSFRAIFLGLNPAYNTSGGFPLPQ